MSKPLDSASLRYLAAAIERRDAMRSYTHDLSTTRHIGTGLTAKVTWPWGSTLKGHQELTDAVSKLVEERLPELIRDAMQQADKEVDQLQDDLARAMRNA
jgi:hypothetical protein